MSENYFNNRSNWVFDTDGNFLHSRRKKSNPFIERDGYFYTNEKEWDEEFEKHIKETENKKI